MSKFKYGHVVLDLDNKEAHYNQIVKIIEAEGMTSLPYTPCTIEDALRVELSTSGSYWLTSNDISHNCIERHIPFVPEVKFKDEYIVLDQDNKEAHYAQIVKVLEAEGKNFDFGDTKFYKATHIRCFRDGTFAYYSSTPDFFDGPERKIPYIPTPERLTLTDNILTVNGKTRYTLTEIEEVEEVEPEEKEFTLSQVVAAVNNWGMCSIGKDDVRNFLNKLEA